MSKDSDNISLIGFMGSGKTTVGEMLAGLLKKKFIDIDNEIELDEKKKISDIFSESGEEYFRKIESEIIGKVYKNKNTVFACGGGVILKKKNMDLIRKNSTVVYLKISADCAVKRVKDDIGIRPLVKGKKSRDIEELLQSRESKYIEYSDHIIDCSCLTPEEACEAIIKKVAAA